MDCACPNSTQSISKPTFWRLAKRATAMTRISRSHALINTDFAFCLAAWSARVRILESASSWLQGCRPSKLMDLFDMDTILSARYSNSSVLLSQSLRKVDQMGDTLNLSVTLHRLPLPYFDRISALRLEFLQTSNTSLFTHTSMSNSKSLAPYHGQHIPQLSLRSLVRESVQEQHHQ